MPTKDARKSLAREREAIAKLKAQHREVQRAPAAREDAKRRVDAFLEQLGSRPELIIQPFVAPTPRGQPERIAFPSPHHREGLVEDGLLALLSGERLREIYLERLDAFYAEHQAGLPAAERAARLAELKREVEEHERAEEQIIRELQAEGLPVERREDANPAIVLGAVFEEAA